METSLLIVCETSGFWAAALRRASDGPSTRDVDAPMRVVETRSLAECRRSALDAPASLVAVRMTPSSLREVIVFLDALKRQLPRVKSVVLADRGLESFHALALEAGAICVVNSPRNVDLIARLAQRHFEQVPRHAQSPAERIWGTLPWSREAAARP